MAVRYDKKFMNEIKNVVNAYNRKIARLSKLDAGYDLPTKFTKGNLETLKKTAINRTEVRRRLKDLQAFTARGGEKNVRVGNTTMPKYQYTNIKRYQRLLKYQTTKKLKRYETTKPVAGGKVQPFTFAQQGSEEYLTLRATRERLLEDVDLGSMSSSELEAYLHKLRVNTKGYDLDIWQKNYIDILQDTALSYGYDDEKLEVIVERLKKLKSGDFDDLAFTNANIKQILTSYKALLDIETWQDLSENSKDVIANLDSIYEDLDDILAKYV